jgi:hypothetical protein
MRRGHVSAVITWSWSDCKLADLVMVGLHVDALGLSRQSANVVADFDWSCVQKIQSFYVRWEEGAKDFRTIYCAPMPTSWMGVRPTPAIEDHAGIFLCVEHMDIWVGTCSHTVNYYCSALAPDCARLFPAPKVKHSWLAISTT